jgi:hypothetical protein
LIEYEFPEGEKSRKEKIRIMAGDKEEAKDVFNRSVQKGQKVAILSVERVRK